ncbi:MAG: hypothetical protein K6F08_03155 [bacterium]|nr:hypothetical protein [bacterium]
MLFIFSKFKGAHWQNYSEGKRLKILQALENKMARKQHRPKVQVRVYPEPEWNNFGVFISENGEQTLFIRQDLIENNDYRFFALETIIHEGRHAYQFYIVKNKKLHFYNFKEKAWKRNWEGYILSEESNVDYNMQAIERDAQSYSINFLKKIAYKYSGERAFQFTFKAIKKRYEESEFEARKTYGLFYKRKINKKINAKKNS